jgi:hypothetical protein
MYTRPPLSCFFFLLFCLLLVIPYWSGVMIILGNNDGMDLLAPHHFAWFQSFIARLSLSFYL